jgi:serine/threonine-protein kinase ULK/ATG1
VIGSGFSSVVYRGWKDNDRSQLFALKVVKTGEMKEHRRRMLENEVKVLKMVQHPHIIEFVDLYYTRNNYYIVTEYCEGGSLQSLIDRNEAFDWAQISYQIGLACRYLAEKHIMHRDIKPANILLKNGKCKLSDFGFTYQF